MNLLLEQNQRSREQDTDVHWSPHFLVTLKSNDITEKVMQTIYHCSQQSSLNKADSMNLRYVMKKNGRERKRDKKDKVDNTGKSGIWNHINIIFYSPLLAINISQTWFTKQN